MKVWQILVLTLMLSGIEFAQAKNDSILSGTVYDATGALIPAAKITAINESGEKFETETNENGNYSLTLAYKIFDNKSASNFRIAKYQIIIDLENRGFEKVILKDFKFVHSTLGKMFLDFALDSKNPEPCGYGGGGCFKLPKVENPEGTVQNKILKKASERLPKEQNKTKRNKNNKK